MQPVAGGPEQVTVATYDNEVAEKLGGHGVALKLIRADGSRRAAPVGVTVDVAGFAGAYGGNFESRLRLIAKPACALTTPASAACTRSIPVPSKTNLVDHKLTATLPAAQHGMVYVVAAAANGEAGSYTAT
ncbi:hypothetical protein AB0E63_43640 [Kribbella sp. NPDC026596]|uniref:hypothetical protein n=1 Tax=Kribbella sp. NPDC026596 TaxID=3155122 RepID=UPI0034021B8E